MFKNLLQVYEVRNLRVRKSWKNEEAVLNVKNFGSRSISLSSVSLIDCCQDSMGEEERHESITKKQ